MYQNFKWTKISEHRINTLRDYEPLQPYVLLELARALGIDTFVDVGANIGVYSIFMSSLDSVKSVYSFEPSPRTFVELSHNVDLNVAAKIKVFKLALSDVSEKVGFGIVGDYSGANSIVRSSMHADKFTKEEIVDCITLDSAGVTTSGKLCVKIDVEGHERHVLLGAQTLLNSNAVIIQMERYEQDEAIDSLLSLWGYRRLFAIGPDCYFTNSAELVLSDVISVIERASQAMISSRLEEVHSTQRPIRFRLLPGIYVETSGTLAGIVRKAKRRIKW